MLVAAGTRCRRCAVARRLGTVGLASLRKPARVTRSARRWQLTGGKRKGRVFRECCVYIRSQHHTLLFVGAIFSTTSSWLDCREILGPSEIDSSESDTYPPWMQQSAWDRRADAYRCATLLVQWTMTSCATTIRRSAFLASMVSLQLLSRGRAPNQ